MKPWLYLPLGILIFLTGLWAGQHLGARNQTPSTLPEGGMTKGAPRQESDRGRVGVLPGSGVAQRSAEAPAARTELPAEKPRALRLPGRSPQNLPMGMKNLTPEKLLEMADSLRRDGIPEEDIQGLLEGLKARFSKEPEGPPYPTLEDLGPNERVTEIKKGLEGSGIPPEDAEAIAQGFNRRMQQSPRRGVPMPAPASPK